MAVREKLLVVSCRSVVSGQLSVVVSGSLGKSVAGGGELGGVPVDDFIGEDFFGAADGGGNGG